ncbi:LOW QUALITY PROTEIN: hypothetical protein V2J09_001814 [Rumex salicifolius]
MGSKYLARDPISVDFPRHYRGYKFPAFKPNDSKKWFEKDKNQLLALFVCSGFTIYLCNQETIPYTNRTHLVFMSTKREKLFSEIRFEEFRKGLFKGKTLATNHPDTLRLTSISRNLIDALTQSDPDLDSYDHFERVGSLIWKRDRAPPETRHIEIGHVVARHLPEQMAKDIWRNILKRMLYYVLMLEVVDKMVSMALAGYDPSAAISTYEKMEKFACNSPPCMIRTQLHTHSMEKAMKLYIFLDARSKEKKAIKEEQMKQEEKYMWAIVDGVKEKMGKLKKRILPSDITLNIGKGVPIPECPIAGERFDL